MDRTEDHITQQDFAGVSESDLSLDTAHVSVCMDVPCDDQSVASPLGDVGSTEPINNAPIHVERSTLIVTDAFETQFSEETHQTLITNVSEEIISEITLEEQTQQTLIINVSEEITSEISLEEETQQTVITNVPEEIVHGISLQEETQQTLSTNVPEEIVPEISLDRKLVSSDESEEHQIADVELSKGSPRDSKELEFVKKGFNRGPDAGTDQEDEQLRQYWTRALEMSRSNVEIVEEIVKVLKHHQNTHDLMCPVCGSCVTKRVILRKRKRSSHFYVNRWYQDPLDQESEVLAKSLPSLSEQKGANENLAVEQNEPLIEAYGCLTCLSLFFQKGSDLFNLFQESAGNDCLTSLFPTYPWGITNMRPGSSVSQVIEEDLRGISGEKSFSCGLVPVLFPSYYWGSSRIAADAGGISQTPSRDDGAEAQPGKSATQTDVGRDIPSTEVHEATDRSMATAHFEVINCLPRPVIFPIYPWGSSPKSLFDQAQLGKSSTGTDVVGRDIPSTELDEATEIVQFEEMNCMPRIIPVIFPIYPWGSSSKFLFDQAQLGKSSIETHVGSDIPSREVHEVADGSTETVQFEGTNCMPMLIPAILPIYPWGSSPKFLFDQAQLGKSSIETDVGRDISSVEVHEATDASTETVRFEGMNCMPMIIPAIFPSYPWGSSPKSIFDQGPIAGIESDTETVRAISSNVGDAGSNISLVSEVKADYSTVSPDDDADGGHCVSVVGPVLLPEYPWGTLVSDKGYMTKEGLAAEVAQQESPPRLTRLKDADDEVLPSDSADVGLEGAASVLLPSYPWGTISVAKEDYGVEQEVFKSLEEASTRLSSQHAYQGTAKSEDVHFDTRSHSESEQKKIYIQRETRIETSKKVVTDWQENVQVSTVSDATSSIREARVKEQLPAASLESKTDKGASLIISEDSNTQRYSGLKKSEIRTSVTLQSQSEVTVLESTQMEKLHAADNSWSVTASNIPGLGDNKVDDRIDKQAIHTQSSDFQWTSQSVYSENVKVKLPVVTKTTVTHVTAGVTGPMLSSVSDIKTPLLRSEDKEDDIETGELVVQAVDTPVPQESRRDVDPWDILKPIVYGGLDISIASLGVTSSAAGGNAITRTVVYMGLATLFSGLIIFYHNVLNLYNDRRDYYKNVVGISLLLHGTVALVSYVLFGALSPIIYGLSFRETDDRDDKFMLCSGVTIVAVILLSLGKAKVSDKRYIKTLCAYLFTGVLSVLIGYLTGEHVSELLENCGI